MRMYSHEKNEVFLKLKYIFLWKAGIFIVFAQTICGAHTKLMDMQLVSRIRLVSHKILL